MPNLGPTELIIILVILLLLFGARRLPDLSRSIGRSVREFRHGLDGTENDGDAPDVPPPTGRDDLVEDHDVPAESGDDPAGRRRRRRLRRRARTSRGAP